MHDEDKDDYQSEEANDRLHSEENANETDESPLPKVNHELEQTKDANKGSTVQGGGKSKEMYIPDNSHIIVEEKLEKLRLQTEIIEQKKKEALAKKQGKELTKEEEEDDDAQKKKKTTTKMILCSLQTKYRVVKKACRRLDYKLNEDENVDWDLYWADTGLQPNRIQKM